MYQKATSPLLDHLVGECEQLVWYCDAQRPGRLDYGNGSTKAPVLQPTKFELV